MQKPICPEFKEQTQIRFLGKEYNVTDLSHELGPSNPTFPGHLKTVLWDHLTHEETLKSGLTKAPYCYRVVGLTTCDHSSTHVDAINHIVTSPGARSIDKLPLEWFLTPGVWFDFSSIGANEYIKKNHIKKAIEETGVEIQNNSAILYFSGWYKKWNSPFEYIKDFPGLDREATEYLVDLGAICIGADAPSIDSFKEVSQIKVQPAHMVCREREVLNMENLANIDKIPRHEFWFIYLPLKIENATGSPVRCVALTEVNRGSRKFGR